MPRSKDLTLASRNLKIQQLRDDGFTMQAIADTVGLSKVRVSQILETMEEEVAVGGYRSFLAANGELGLAEIMKILRKESPIKIAASGKLMYYPDVNASIPGDTRGMVFDFDRPILDDSVKIDAVKALPPPP